MSRFLDALRSGRILLMDGAMGTELQRAGLRPGECGELWNLTHPEKVRAIHQAYVDAGAEVLLTNTFQANPAALQRYNVADQCEVICGAAVELARQAAGPNRWVLADIGPYQSDVELQGLQTLVKALAQAGTDGFLIETCSDSYPLLNLWKVLDYPLRQRFPVLVSFTYRRDRDNQVRTISGLSAAQIASWIDDCSVPALGINCGRDIGLPQIAEVVVAYRGNVSRPIFARPNAGTPKQVEDRWVYPHSPEYMASWLPELLKAGVSMIGGCCGTTPAHIAAFKPIVDAWNARRPL
jgi:5-methyltetrahydrofolate--homocysteine methyltransferase